MARHKHNKAMGSDWAFMRILAEAKNPNPRDFTIGFDHNTDSVTVKFIRNPKKKP